MTKKKSRVKYLVLVLLLGVGVLVGYLVLETKKVLNFLLPEITEITLIKADIHSDTAFVNVSAIVLNKAPYPMNIDSIICELTLDGTKLISTSNYVGLHQKVNAADTVSFAINIPISKMRGKIASLQGEDSTGVQIHATIVYSNYKIDLAKTKEIEVPVPPQLRLVKTDRKDLKLFKKDVKVDLYVEVVNNGKLLSLDIHDMQYDLTLGTDLTTHGKYGKDVSIRPHSSLMLLFPLDFTMNNPAATIMKVWMDNDRVPFRLKLSGFLDAGKMKRIPVVIFASGKMEIVNEDKKKAEKKLDKRERKKRRE